MVKPWVTGHWWVVCCELHTLLCIFSDGHQWSIPHSVHVFLYLNFVGQWVDVMGAADRKRISSCAFSPQEEDNKSPVSYPSLLSHMTSSFLNHPFLPMVLSGQLPASSFDLLSEFPLLQSPLPCDIHLVNLRTIQSKVNAKICLHGLASYVLYLVQG